MSLTPGTRELRSDGSVQLAADGKVRLADGINDNCCCACWTCNSCTDTTPAAYIVTITGVTACASTCCRVNLNPGGNGAIKEPGNANGTYTLNCDPLNVCRWVAENTWVDYWSEWEEFDCTGFFRGRDAWDADVDLRKLTDGGGKYFQLTAGSISNLIAFSGKVYVDTCNASGGYTVSNTNTCGACPPWQGAGQGGSADIDPVAL